MDFTPTRYFLQSVKSGQHFPDNGWTLDAPGESSTTLIRAIYENRQLSIRNDLPGLYKFADWLPIGRILEGSSAPVTYKSEKLASFLGLSNLWITFSGYWPEKDAGMTTCSFKETEAFTVCARLQPDNKKALVVASAGNTARAFAKVCSDNRIPLLLCVPEDNLNALWFEKPLNECVKLVCSQKGGDYFDAIHLSNIVASMEGFIAEGGAKNVARRDGMGTTVLSAVTTIGQIPDYYFQAVGSGTGAIAAWEANLRLLCDGRFGTNKMKLMVSQNAPFQPMYDAWKQGSRSLLPCDDNVARSLVEAIDAKVLSNRKPQYSPVGGIFDALSDSEGEVMLATNEEAQKAASVFNHFEGIDVHPAPAVALATLFEAVEKNLIDKTKHVMINITGGGEVLFKSGRELYYLQPNLVFPVNPTCEDVRIQLKNLF